MPAETVSCSWTRDPTKTRWHSVPKVEFCPGALLCNDANTDAGFTSAGTYIINQSVNDIRAADIHTFDPLKLPIAMQFAVR